ncbi:hypothetical protein FGRMN_11154, partial [Fusarium graminum]
MSRSSYSYDDDDDDYDIRYQKRGPSPGGVRYVANPQLSRNYREPPPGPSYTGADRLNISSTHRAQSRSRSREISLSRERRASSPPAPAPVIINNRIYNDFSSDD